MHDFWSPRHRPAFGLWIKLPAPEVLEVLAPSGIDFVVLDGEHGALDTRSISAMIGLGRAMGLTVFVRVAGHARADIQPALDAGADGVFVPHVDSAALAAQVVDVCRFPPAGSRSASLATRAGGWGRMQSADYLRRGSDVIIVAQVESPAAVEAVSEITAVAGLDAIFVGPYDLALTSGLSPADPEFHRLVESAESARGPAVIGSTAAGADEVRLLAERGYSFVVVGADTSILGAGAQSLLSEFGEGAAA
ncbi:HpcH/HpaI aldolase family protein [Microbacterium rhizomatis]|uniref:HpcH/HpaI aldolase family protein n=1 Tax=Microbacterium rhizomatis TaxID=1631477 RepID=UPI00147866F7|nr:aldolase/citrate lyase family protein [Microbacterium rhizomatis]